MDEEIFDTETFIAEVKKRPILWNTSVEEYHDRTEKQSNWMELTRVMYPSVAGKDMSKTGALLMKKWKNIKDNYMRNRRQLKNGRTTKKRKYIYSKNLAFLKSILADTATENSLDDTGNTACSDSSEEKEDDNFDDISENAAFASAVTAEVCSTIPAISLAATPCEDKTHSTPDNPLLRKRLLEESMIDYLRTQRGVHKPDEDESFFDSIIPTIRQFDVDQKFEFRIQVMSLIQNIRKNASYYNPSNKIE